MNRPTIYLAGSIRDRSEADIEWRDRFADELHFRATILTPLGNKRFDPETGAWTMSGIPSTSRAIFAHDTWMIDHAQIVVANLLSLSEGYPSLGTLIELGRATARGALIYLICKPDYSGCSNPAMFRVHPFLEQIAAATFPTVEDCLDFLRQHLDVLSGARPRFGGVMGGVS